MASTPRPMWKGHITVGLLTIPVRACLAVDPPSSGAHLLHRDCMSRIQMKTWCPEHGELSRADTVRGWEVGLDQWVALSDAELDSLPLASKHTIAIEQVVDRSDAARLKAFSKPPYYIEAEAGGQHALPLFGAALERKGAAAVCKIAFRDREQLATLEPHRGALLLTTVAWPNEIRSVPSLDAKGERFSRAERELAEMLVTALQRPLDLTGLHDAYGDALDALIAAKTLGGEVVSYTAPAGPVLRDLMAVLEASVAAARGAAPAPTPIAGARKRRAAA